jgi:hypothetical protein
MDETALFMDENVTFQSYGSKGHFMDETAKLMEKKNTSQCGGCSAINNPCSIVVRESLPTNAHSSPPTGPQV